jgi:hypothetical protein
VELSGATGEPPAMIEGFFQKFISLRNMMKKQLKVCLLEYLISNVFLLEYLSILSING